MLTIRRRDGESVYIGTIKVTHRKTAKHGHVLEIEVPGQEKFWIRARKEMSTAQIILDIEAPRRLSITREELCQKSSSTHSSSSE